MLMEVPVCRFSWESYHSELNQVGGVVVPAPRICAVLRLSNRQGEWDLRDRDGKVGTLYRVCQRDRPEQRFSLTYMRTDLLAEYLRLTGQKLVWFVWGERTLRYTALGKLGRTEDFQRVYRDYKHIHARWRVLDSAALGGMTEDSGRTDLRGMGA